MDDFRSKLHPLLRRLFVVFAVGMAACQHSHILPSDAATTLRSAATPSGMLGELIYQGAVNRRDSTAPSLYRYERRVLAVTDGLRSSHLTLSPAGEPVVIQRAHHTSSYELLEFLSLIHI